MRLGPWEIGRRSEALPSVGNASGLPEPLRPLPAGVREAFADERVYGSAPRGDLASPQAGAVGSGELSLFAGLMDSEESTPELVGRTRYRIYDAMRASDSACKGLLWSVKLPIRAADWRLVPASADPLDLLIADAVKWAIGLDEEEGRLVGGLDGLLRLFLLAIDYGSITGELEWADVETWVDDEGDPHLVRPLVRVGRRLPHTIAEYGAARSTDEPLAYVKQDVPAAVTIPGAKLVHVALEPEIEPYRGLSLLRACYGPWNLKRNLIVSSAIGFDRFAAGIPVVRYPASTGDKGRRIAEEIGRNLRLNERAYIALPGSLDEGWNVEILAGNGSLADPVPLLEHYDKLIMLSGLAQFSQLGNTAHGSRAVGEVLADPFYQALQTLAGAIAETITRQVIARWVRVNFGDVDVPKIEVANIQHRNIPVLFNALAAASTAGLSFADVETINVLRAILGLPEILAPTVPEGGVAATALDRGPGGTPPTNGNGARPPGSAPLAGRVPTPGSVPSTGGTSPIPLLPGGPPIAT